MTVLRFRRAEVAIGVEKPSLAGELERALGEALTDLTPPPRYPTVRLRTRRRLAALGVAAVEGKVALVRVTERGLARLPRLVEELRAADVLAVQLVWDGVTPPRERAESTIFRVLEAARATKARPPVFLAAERAPVLALRAAVAARRGAS